MTQCVFEAGGQEVGPDRKARLRRGLSHHAPGRPASLRWLQIDGKFGATAADQPRRLVGVVATSRRGRALEAEAERLSITAPTIQEEERRQTSPGVARFNWCNTSSLLL